MTTKPAPAGKTARRLEWPFLPPNLRAYIERKCGSPVVEAESQGAGYTPGFASVLTCEDGSRHFVKAASVKAQRIFAVSYREEARKLAALPESVASPAAAVASRRRLGGARPRVRRRPQPEPPVAPAGPRRLPGRHRADGGRPHARARGARPGHLRGRVRRAGRPLGPRPVDPARPAPPGGSSRARGRVRRGDRRPDARPHRPARRQLPDRRATARSGCATGTGRWSAPTGWTRCSS